MNEFNASQLYAGLRLRPLLYGERAPLPCDHFVALLRLLLLEGCVAVCSKRADVASYTVLALASLTERCDGVVAL